MTLKSLLFASSLCLYSAVFATDATAATPATAAAPVLQSDSTALESAQNPAREPSQNPAQNADVAFSHVYVSVEGGEIYPWGDLLDVVENSVYAGIGFRYAYWPNLDGIVHFDYTYFKMRMKDVPYPGVHQFMGRMGLDWHARFVGPLMLGGGFTCNWSRSDGGDESNFNQAGGTLSDNETEFGYFLHINVPFVRYERLRVGFDVLWEQLWTLPERSNMLYAGLYVEWRLW